MNKQDLKNKAFQYYCKGLNSKEIGKLLNLSYRTIQGYMSKENWKAKRSPTPIKRLAYDLHLKGLSYNGIAKTLHVSRSTIYNWITETKQNLNQKKGS